MDLVVKEMPTAQTDLYLLPSLVNEQQDAAEYYEKILRLTSSPAAEVKVQIIEKWYAEWGTYLQPAYFSARRSSTDI